MKLLCTCIVALAAASVYASPTIRMLNDSTPAYSMKILEDGFAGYAVSSVVSTFCVERNEYFTPGSSYYAVLNTAAVDGGVGGPDPDPLDERSAYLYTQFLGGNLTDQAKLQNAIWYIEQEIGTSNDYVTLADNAVNDGLWSGLGNVRVANLYKNYSNGVYSGFAQDQIIAIQPVPVPGALLLAGMGTVMVGLIRRRKRATV